MASNTSSASCAQPPHSLIVEKTCQLNNPGGKDEQKPQNSRSSSPGGGGKLFTPKTQQRLKDYLYNSDSVAVSSCDEHTPPTDPPKPILRRDVKPGSKGPVKTIQRQYKQVKYATPTAIRDDELVELSPNDLSRAMRTTWARYPPPANEEFPVGKEFNFTPKLVANEIDPAGLFERSKQRSEVSFIQPLCLQGAVRNEYAAHLAYEKQDHDDLMEKVFEVRRTKAEYNATNFYDSIENNQPSKICDSSEVNRPIKFPVLSPEVQMKIYDDESRMSALSRKIAICDGSIEGMIAGEFTYNKDTAHLPPTEDQMAILREAEGLRDFFPKAPHKLSLYDQWLKDQSADPCPASNWLKDEERLAKKKAFESAYSKQLESRFPPKPLKNQMPTKLQVPDQAIGDKPKFSYMLPKTSVARERQSMRETPVAVQVPKWLPAFVDYEIVPIDKSASAGEQYKNLLTTIWKLESQMLKETKTSKWDKNWHDANPRWNKPHHKKSEFCSAYHRGKRESYDTFNETKANKNLSETDVVPEEFSFDDVFTFGQDSETEISSKKSPEVLLKEIAAGVRKAISKVGM
ncbi:hypothetical protein HYE68_003648 [Fusarium pseudograminearum]|nr:hypothetical protein HYE68_003648 [Fusarium pseudograminearum]